MERIEMQAHHTSSGFVFAQVYVKPNDYCFYFAMSGLPCQHSGVIAPVGTRVTTSQPAWDALKILPYLPLFVQPFTNAYRVLRVVM